MALSFPIWNPSFLLVVFFMVIIYYTWVFRYIFYLNMCKYTVKMNNSDKIINSIYKFLNLSKLFTSAVYPYKCVLEFHLIIFVILFSLTFNNRTWRLIMLVFFLVYWFIICLCFAFCLIPLSSSYLSHVRMLAFIPNKGILKTRFVWLCLY
jgi:hypothetical protein